MSDAKGDRRRDGGKNWKGGNGQQGDKPKPKEGQADRPANNKPPQQSKALEANGNQPPRLHSAYSQMFRRAGCATPADLLAAAAVMGQISIGPDAIAGVYAALSILGRDTSIPMPYVRVALQRLAVPTGAAGETVYRIMATSGAAVGGIATTALPPNGTCAIIWRKDVNAHFWVKTFAVGSVTVPDANAPADQTAAERRTALTWASAPGPNTVTLEELASPTVSFTQGLIPYASAAGVTGWHFAGNDGGAIDVCPSIRNALNGDYAAIHRCAMWFGNSEAVLNSPSNPFSGSGLTSTAAGAFIAWLGSCLRCAPAMQATAVGTANWGVRA